MHNSLYITENKDTKINNSHIAQDYSYVSTNYPSLKNYRKKNEIDATQEVRIEAIKNEKVNEERLNTLVRGSHQPLFHLSNVFPFDLFTDEITVEIAQVNVIKRYFFATAHLHTIPIKNIADIFLETSLFFASIKIVDISYIESSIQVEYLKKEEACKARRIIQGLVTAKKEDIDFNKIPAKSLVQAIESLGQADDVEIIC
ncbi:MAG: hypothetical protein AAB478_01325 [Patescibacteria group bacterium]